MSRSSIRQNVRCPNVQCSGRIGSRSVTTETRTLLVTRFSPGGLRRVFGLLLRPSRYCPPEESTVGDLSKTG